MFRIPEYQRAYSWTTDQRDDLFNDIKRTHEGGADSVHFMAALVCLRRARQDLGTDEFHVLEVVDGQQRITTLIILLNAVKLVLNDKIPAERKVGTELADLLVKQEGDELLLLQTNHDSSNHFSTYLRKGTAPSSKKAKTLADRELLEAIEECTEFVATWRNDGNTLLDLMALLKNRLFFLLHEIDDEKTVYTVFEVLNSRGLDVSWLDRLKSMLMGAAFELKKSNSRGVIKELHTTWRQIYAVVGLRQGISTESLRYTATLRTAAAPRRPLGERDSAHSLRDEATTATSIREVATWLLNLAEACDAVLANDRINAVTRISQARLLATAVNLRKDLKESDRDALLERWERVSFRIYGMLGKDARTRVGDYVRLAWRVVNEKLSPKEIHQEISEIGEEFPIDKAVAALRNTNCYEDWEIELRYLMYRYEEYLAKKRKVNFSNAQWARIWSASPTQSIEHIWANSKAPVKQRHRLGNLVLLPPNLNSKLQDLDPEKKVSEYRDTGLLIASEAAKMIETSGWNKRAIEEREEKILAWANSEWAD